MASKKKLYYYYYLVIDLEGSSSQNIPLDIQIEKLEKLRLCVNKILNPKSRETTTPPKENKVYKLNRGWLFYYF